MPHVIWERPLKPYILPLSSSLNAGCCKPTFIKNSLHLPFRHRETRSLQDKMQLLTPIICGFAHLNDLIRKDLVNPQFVPSSPFCLENRITKQSMPGNKLVDHLPAYLLNPRYRGPTTSQSELFYYPFTFFSSSRVIISPRNRRN